MDNGVVDDCRGQHHAYGDQLRGIALDLNMRAFASFHVQPSYGNMKSAISWTLQGGEPGDTMLLFRSVTGGNAPWVQIGSVPARQGFYVDDISVTRENTAQKIYYRGCVVSRDGTETDGPVVTFLSALTPHEVKQVIRLLRNELRIMSGTCRGGCAARGAGIPVAMFAPLESGTPSANYNAVTRQFAGTTAKQDGVADSYGMPYVGGFGPQLNTWMRFIQDAEEKHDGTAEQPGDRQGRVVRARMLAFPRPASDYMVVQPESDDRFIIGAKVDPYAFKGILPFAYEADLVRLERSDARYRLPVKVESFDY